MDQGLKEFSDKLGESAVLFFKSFEKSRQDWSPSVPPDTIVLAEAGEVFVSEFFSVDKVTRERIFLIIEAAMGSSDLYLKTIVATGLVEGIVGRANREGIWEKVREEMGAMTRSHAEKWYNGET